MDIIIMILLIFQLLRKWSLNIEDKHTSGAFPSGVSLRHERF